MKFLSKSRQTAHKLSLLVSAVCVPAVVNADIYVVTYSGQHTILRYSDSGEFREVFIPKGTAGLDGAQSLVFGGPQGELFITDGFLRKILVFDPLTGLHKRSISDPEFGQLYGIAIGPDGMLYTTSAFGSEVHKVNPVTGQYHGPFNIGGNLQTSRAVTFDSAGTLFVGSDGTDSVKKYDDIGFYIGEGATGSIDGPDGIAFLPNGNIAVCSFWSSHITEHNPSTGAFVRVLVPKGTGGLGRPRHVLLTHNQQLLVCDTAESTLSRFDPSTGAFLGYFAIGGLLEGPVFAAYGPTLTFSSVETLTIDRGNVVAGGLSAIQASDDFRLLMRPGVVFTTSLAPIVFTVQGTAPMGAGRLRFDIESSGTSANIAQTTQLYNYKAGQFQTIGVRAMTPGDTQARYSPENSEDFIEPGTRAVRARVQAKLAGPSPSYPWTARFDHARWVFGE